MAVSGNLRTMPFPDLMEWISMGRKTGTLVIKGQRYTKKILFQKGTVSAVTSNNPREHLGYYLVGWDILSEEELEQLLDQQKEHHVMLGELLVQKGRLNRTQVDHMVRVKTEETIYDLMLWQEGEFFFLDDVQPRRDFKELDLPVSHFIFEGARQSDERRRIAELIPDSDHIPKVCRGLDETQLTPTGLAVLQQINGARSIEEIALRCHVPEFPVLAFVYQGMQNGVFELLPPVRPARRIPGFQRSSWRDRILQAENSMALGDALDAYRKVVELRERYPNVSAANEAADALEQEIAREADKLQLPPSTVLELALAPKDIVQLKCAPEEGFVLSRINGMYTVAQILALVPGAKLYNQLIIHNLLQRGVIKLRESQQVVKHPGIRRPKQS
ncbi:MAG TPA: DUF4388 domain-containing protein [Thermoanaerobaculaceae bacterium]|nr:DUF4388 domain-containing protein [Thermoanaerobaculaceae bacterium]